MAVMCEGAWSITRLSNSRRVDDMHFSIQVATLRRPQRLTGLRRDADGTALQTYNLSGDAGLKRLIEGADRHGSGCLCPRHSRWRQPFPLTRRMPLHARTEEERTPRPRHDA